MTATTPGMPRASTENPTTTDGPDRATRAADARLVTRDAATVWPIPPVAGIGQTVAVAITPDHPGHRQPLTWADALSRVDPDLLTPISTVPDGWPLLPAAWRRDMRTRMMTRLKHAGWVTYSTRPRSLQLGPHGRAWLTATRVSRGGIRPPTP